MESLAEASDSVEVVKIVPPILSLILLLLSIAVRTRSFVALHSSIFSSNLRIFSHVFKFYERGRYWMFQRYLKQMVCDEFILRYVYVVSC
jgi:hypothetical protein